MEAEIQCDIDGLSMFAADIIRQAGREATKFYGKGNHNIKFDENLITEAEIHLSDFFHNRVMETYPDHGIFKSDQLAEGYSHGANRYLWIFDPLDGVDNFQTGMPIWAMSLALFENFWPIFGMVYMPSTEDLFQAQADGKALNNSTPMQISSTGIVDDESLLFIFSRFHQRFHSKFPGKIRNLGCTAAHICYVATGRADAAIIANESFQDLAAALIIVEAAGGGIFRVDGSPFHLSEYIEGRRIDGPLVVTAPGKLNAIISCLTASE